MSPQLLEILQRAERDLRAQVSASRRGYRRSGMSPWEVSYYGARRNWPDACDLLRLYGARPYGPLEIGSYTGHPGV